MPRLTVHEPVVAPTAADIAWAAGFLEGDGYFGKNRTTLEVSATQKTAWPLERLQEMFGGTLGQVTKQGLSRGNTYWRWRISGNNARRCWFLVRDWMSPRRQQQGEFFDVYE